MSVGARLPFDRALAIAQDLVQDLAPVVVRVKVAGSLRRRAATVGDIELVIEPKTVVTQSDLFHTAPPSPDIEAIERVARSWGEVGKDGERFIQVRHVLGIDGLVCDLFVCWAPAQWGSTLAIRTGPARLGKWAVTRMHDFGLRHVAGHVERVATGETVPTPTEEDFFAAAGLPCLAPRLRDTRAAFRPIDAHERTEVER